MSSNQNIQLVNQSELNKISKIIDNNSNYISPNLSISAAGHNGIYRGRDLTNIYTIDEICQMVSDGTFEDLYIGDYITVTIPDVSYTIGDTEYIDPSQEVDIVFADFNTIYDSNTTKNHITCVPRKCFNLKAAMNSTNTTEGGYVATDMHTIVLPAYTTALQEVLNNHIINYYTKLPSGFNESGSTMDGISWSGGGYGYTSEWINSYTQLCLMNEIQVYGVRVGSSSLYDIGEHNTQFSLFRLETEFIYKLKTSIWLSTTPGYGGYSNSMKYCYCGYIDGIYTGQSTNEYGVLPYFLID
jgi:hypothetical protein